MDKGNCDTASKREKKIKSELSPQEKDIIESFEQGEWESIAGAKAEIQRYQQYAKVTFKTDRRVNIHISKKDIEIIRKKAIEEGIALSDTNIKYYS